MILRTILFSMLLTYTSCNSFKSKRNLSILTNNESLIFSTKEWKTKTLNCIKELEKDASFPQHHKHGLQYVFSLIEKKHENYLENVFTKIGFNNTVTKKSKEFYLMTFFSSGEVYREDLDVIENKEKCKYYLFDKTPWGEKFSSSKKNCSEKLESFHKLKNSYGEYTYFGTPGNSFTTLWYYDSVADTSLFRIFFDPYVILNDQQEEINNFLKKK